MSLICCRTTFPCSRRMAVALAVKTMRWWKHTTRNGGLKHILHFPLEIFHALLLSLMISITIPKRTRVMPPILKTIIRIFLPMRSGKSTTEKVFKAIPVLVRVWVLLVDIIVSLGRDKEGKGKRRRGVFAEKLPLCFLFFFVLLLSLVEGV